MLRRTLTLAALLAAFAAPPAPPLGAQQAGPAVVVHRQPALPLVAIRLSVLVDDPPGHAGAGHLIQHLVYPALQDQAALVGAQARIERTADAVVYSVLGPAAELDHLARALRAALEPARPAEGALLTAQRTLAEERLAEWETAGQHVRSVLRARIFPADLSAAGTEASARRITASLIPELWARMYRPDRVSVLAVGDVGLADIERAFARLPAPAPRSAAAERTDTVSATPLAPAEATRGWIGVGYPVSGLDPAAVSVATRLLSDALGRGLGTSEVDGEHWWTHHGQAVVLTVAAPGAGLAAAQRAVGTAVSTLRGELSDRQVREATRALRREMLFYSRTPDRMAEVLGRFIDRGGEPDAAQRFYASLDRVGAAEVRAVLDQLLARTAVRVDLSPQKVNTR